MTLMGMILVVIAVLIVRVLVIDGAMMVVIVIAMIGRSVRAVIMAGVTAAGIGSAFGIERRFDLDHFCAQPLHHLLDDMIAADAKSLAGDLRRQMPIAEMPRHTHQMTRIGDANLNQRFRRGHHFDQSSVFQHQRIAAP